MGIETRVSNFLAKNQAVPEKRMRFSGETCVHAAWGTSSAGPLKSQA
jgi:hypothetical protein